MSCSLSCFCFFARSSSCSEKRGGAGCAYLAGAENYRENHVAASMRGNLLHALMRCIASFLRCKFEDGMENYEINNLLIHN